MRYNEINEVEITDPDHMDINILNKIIEECSDIVSIMRQTKKFLYRGVDGKPSVFKSRPREARRPRDNAPELHHAINAWLREHGFYAVRANSLFVTSLFGMTDQYGKPYVIFPVNGFKYTWFQKGAGDLFIDMQNMYGSSATQLKPGDDPVEMVDKLMKKVHPTDQNIVVAMRKNNEIMLAGMEYYAIDYLKYKKLLRHVVLEMKI
jgi:hypothetical protein